MPFKTPYGKHFHMIEGCHGATIPCNDDGLEPCSDCCWGSSAGAGTGAGTGAGAAIGGSAAGEYTIPAGLSDADEAQLRQDLDTWQREATASIMSGVPAPAPPVSSGDYAGFVDVNGAIESQREGTPEQTAVMYARMREPYMGIVEMGRSFAVTGDRESRDTCDVLVLSDRVSTSEVAAVVVTTSGRSLLKGKRTGDIRKWDTRVMAMSEAELQAFRNECAKLGRGPFPHGDDVAGILRGCVSEDATLAEERGGKAPLAALNDVLLDVSRRRLGYQSGPRGTDYRPVQIEAAQRREARKAAKEDGYDFDDDDRGYRVDENGRVRYPMDLRSLGHSAPLNVQMYVRARDRERDRARAEADRDRRNPY